MFWKKVHAYYNKVCKNVTRMYVMITFVWMKVYPTGNNDKVIDIT